MITKKRMLSLILCVCIALAFASCGTSDSSSVTEQKVDASFTLDEENSTASKVRVTTTLPVGMTLELMLKAGSTDYYSTETVTVKGDSAGNYVETSQLVTKEGKSLSDGKFILNIESKLPSSQSENVRAIIGETGEKLAGTDVYKSDGEYITKINRIIVLKDGKFTAN